LGGYDGLTLWKAVDAYIQETTDDRAEGEDKDSQHSFNQGPTGLQAPRLTS